MNPLLQTLASPEWALIVKSLLHTVWQGAIASALLAVALRGIPTPAWRYRLAMAALGLTLVSGMVTWAALKQPQSTPIAAVLPKDSFHPAEENVGTKRETVVVRATAQQSVRPAPSWTAWLALTWLCGAALMLLRAGVKISGAERLRRASKPLNDPAIERLFDEARALLATTRRIRIAVTDQLTSPAVTGFLVPTLILPLSLVTTLSHEQIRFILLHELAHVRRGDYLANIFQLFAEALLFFNPAVWWISHQIRREREACCDALAIELSGAPVDYARTLVHVAERGLNQTAAAPAFGERHGSSSLTDRIQRLLVPGYRPALRLTRRAIVASFMLTGILLFVAAAGTRMTIAAILTPQQRMERIEKKLAEYDQISEIPTYDESEAAQKVSVSGRIRTEDDSPLPRMTWINTISVVRNGSIGSSLAVKPDGTFQGEVNPGNLILSVEAPGFAPFQFGPVAATGTNSLRDVQLVLKRGFQATFHLINASTGEPVPAAKFHARFWTRGASQTSFTEHLLKTATDGSAVLTNASDLPLTVSINIPGYELLEHQFSSVTSGVPLRIALRPARTVSGLVRDKPTGAPIAGAIVRVLHEKGASSRHYEWRDTKWIVAESAADGKFEIRQLRSATKYWLGINAPGRESAIVECLPGQETIEVQLGPELIVKGTVTGNFEALQKINRDFALGCSQVQLFDGSSHPEHLWLPLRITNGVGHFQFTNRVPGMVTLSARAGGAFSRMIDAPVSDWSIQLEDSASSATNIPRRDVVFRFTNKNGPAPRGTVAIRTANIADPKRWAYYYEEKEIVDGQVSIAIPVGAETSLEPRRMIGFWFDPAGPNGSLRSIPVTNGAGPLVIQVPVAPAGAIYARAFTADGKPLGGLLFGVHEIKRSPHRSANSHFGTTSDDVSGDTPRKWASPTLPLGGTYQVYGWRGNSFAVSKPITLTEAEPDAEIQLRFPPGKTLEGVLLAPGGNPIPNAELTGWFTMGNNHGFGLKPIFTDENGRFQVQDATPDVGEYSIEPTIPGILAERIRLKLTSSPQVIQLKPGRHLGGQVVESESGDPIPGIELRGFPNSDGASTVTTRTDAQGRFLFTTLRDADYTLFVQDAERLDNRKLPADGSTNHILRVKLQPWSKVQPRKSGISSSNTSAKVHRLRDPNGQPVEVTADYVTFDPGTAIFTASNNVVLKHANTVIRADRTIINQKSGKISSSGSVSVQRDESSAVADAATYDFNTGVLSLQGVPSSGRRAILDKLQNIRIKSFAADALPLSDVIRQLSQQVRMSDPQTNRINFLINPVSVAAMSSPMFNPETGLPVAASSNSVPAFDPGTVLVTIRPALTNARLADLLEAITRSTEKPIKYSILDYGIMFSAKGEEAPALHIRTFKVDGSPFKAALENAISRTNLVTLTDLQRAFIALLASNKVDLMNPPRNVFINTNEWTIMIRATAQELDEAEKIIGELGAVRRRPEPGSGSNSTNRSTPTPGAFAPLTTPPVIQTSPARRALMSKLNQLRFDSISFTNRTLLDVLNELTAKTRELDPEKKGVNFSIAPALAATAISQFINPVTGLPESGSTPPRVQLETLRVTLIPALTGVRLLDVLDAIVTVTDRPLRYSIHENGIVFSERTVDPPQMHIRTFKVDPEALARRAALSGTNATPSAVQEALLNFFTEAGATLTSETGRNVFYGDRDGRLMIRATREELDKIETHLRQNGLLQTSQSPATNAASRASVLVQNARFHLEAGKLDEAEVELNQALSIDPKNEAALYYKTLVEQQKRSALEPFRPASFHINVRAEFYELPEAFARQLWRNWGATNTSETGTVSAVITPVQAEAFRTVARQRKDIRVLANLAVTTANARPAQIQAVESRHIVFPGSRPEVTSTNEVLFGPQVALTASRMNDGPNLELIVCPSVLEFVGHDDPGLIMIEDNTAGTKQPHRSSALPRFRMREMATRAAVPNEATLVLGNPKVFEDHQLPPKVQVENKTPENQLVVLVTPTLINSKGERINPSK